MPVRVAIDAMGGDHAPAAVIEGAVAALADIKSDVHLIFIGPEDTVKSELDRIGAGSDLPLSIVHASQIIQMDESPAAALKKKTDSSIHVGLGLHKAGKADCFLSGGNTGAVMAASLFILGRIANVSRPTIAIRYPTTKGTCALMDVGANVDCKPEHLVQFARMGAVMAAEVLGEPNATIALMNVGEEPGKGTEAVKEAYDILAADKSLNFIGNIEGRDLINHKADIVVCDGFVGNVMLKLSESFVSVFPKLIMDELSQMDVPDEFKTCLGQLFRKMKQFDHENTGGAPLLGVDGTVMIGHGGSTVRAFSQMTREAVHTVQRDLPSAIARALGQ